MQSMGGNISYLYHLQVEDLVQKCGQGHIRPRTVSEFHQSQSNVSNANYILSQRQTHKHKKCAFNALTDHLPLDIFYIT